MNERKIIWLLSSEGILDQSGNLIPDTPFGESSVIAGGVGQDCLAVIVDSHDVWTFVSGTWQQITSADVSLNCLCWTADNRLLVGTEGARLAWAANGDLHFIDVFDSIAEREFWKTPWGGPPDVRSLAVATDGTIYANIHVGWIACSRDAGGTWQALREGLEMDVHQVATHLSNPSQVIAATASGFYLSDDYGHTFICQSDGMSYHYQRACACFADEDIYLVSTSRGPHGRAESQLFRSENAGRDWGLVEGLPENIDKNIDTFQIIIVDGGCALVIIEDTILYETNDWGMTWNKVGENYPRLFGALVL
ncbi:MAG: hypothetical protein VX677_02245 [Candidatus Poribacteria bacterium]|nr:hypothetical protein [Candidatus Poribacteria bacterium]